MDLTLDEAAEYSGRVHGEGTLLMRRRTMYREACTGRKCIARDTDLSCGRSVRYETS